MSFIQDITRLNIHGCLEGDLVIDRLKESDVYKRLDMINYVLTDDDKLPMALYDGSKTINNDFQYTLESSKHYMNSALVNAKRLVKALEKELVDINTISELYGYEYVK